MADWIQIILAGNPAIIDQESRRSWSFLEEIRASMGMFGTTGFRDGVREEHA